MSVIRVFIAWSGKVNSVGQCPSVRSQEGRKRNRELCDGRRNVCVKRLTTGNRKKWGGRAVQMYRYKENVCECRRKWKLQVWMCGKKPEFCNLCLKWTQLYLNLNLGSTDLVSLCTSNGIGKCWNVPCWNCSLVNDILEKCQELYSPREAKFQVVHPMRHAFLKSSSQTEQHFA